MSLRDEATRLLQGLLRLNTVSPPGNETVAAVLLRDYLAASGVACELVGRSPDRLNLVARLEGGDPTLALLAHSDTVRADAQEWSRDPWGGDLVDGELWGRGALDMNSQVAASAVAVASLAREGIRPADEEVNENYGLSWLREAFDTVAYGFFPLRTMSGEVAARLVHSADERIPVDDLELAVHAFRAVATTLEG